jgi:hypothetical protein
MNILSRAFCFFLFVLCAVTFSTCEEPVKVSVCQLKNDPPAYNHKLVVVTGFVSHGFEDFTLFDPDCPSWPAVWLEYGGTTKSGTIYCCDISDDRHRPKELTVEKIPIPLIVDQQFEDFDKRIQPPYQTGQHGAVEHATLVGRYFAGEVIEYPKGRSWGGFGHMGCCMLLAIQQVKNPDTPTRTDLDYGEASEQPDIDKPGCGYRGLLPIEPRATLMQAQRQAENGERDWAFSDPRRVAIDTLSRLGNIDPASLVTIKKTHDYQAHEVYEWQAHGNHKNYMAVVSRPYWLSFYARDSHRVAWVAVAAYESSCDGHNTMTRIR